MRCFGQLSLGFWLAGRCSGTGRRPLLGKAQATRDATTSTAKQVFVGELETVQEGRDKTQTPSRWGWRAGTQHCEPRAHQTMQTENTLKTHGSWSAHTEMPPYGLWTSSLRIVPVEVLNASWDQE